MSEPRIIVALDYPDAKSALELASRLDPTLCRLKVGKELFTAAGPALLAKLHKPGFGIFLDLKYHDIPNTVAGACRAAAELGVWMINVHALGGRAMMTAAREALSIGMARPKITAVTLLTSMGAGDIKDVGLGGSPQEVVARLARLAQECGLDGVVCSPQETAVLRRQSGRSFMLVTPGIRPCRIGAGRPTTHRHAAPGDRGRRRLPRHRPADHSRARPAGGPAQRSMPKFGMNAGGVTI